MRSAVGIFGVVCGLIAIGLVGRYGFKSTDIEADAWIVAFLFGAIAAGGSVRTRRRRSAVAHQSAGVHRRRHRECRGSAAQSVELAGRHCRQGRHGDHGAHYEEPLDPRRRNRVEAFDRSQNGDASVRSDRRWMQFRPPGEQRMRQRLPRSASVAAEIPGNAVGSVVTRRMRRRPRPRPWPTRRQPRRQPTERPSWRPMLRSSARSWPSSDPSSSSTCKARQSPSCSGCRTRKRITRPRPSNSALPSSSS